MNSPVRTILLGGALLASVCLIACTPYRIEYHKRPAFYKQASERDLVDEVVLDDGTIVKFIDQGIDSNVAPMAPSTQAAAGSVDALAGEGEGAQSQLRDQRPDGTIVLRAYAPEHVLSHAKRGIRQREYRVLWDQLLASRARAAYERQGQGYEEFAQFCEENRPAMMETFNRMGFGLYSPDVVQESLGTESFRYRLHPSLGDQFTFTEFDIVREPSGLKWLMIR